MSKPRAYSPPDRSLLDRIVDRILLVTAILVWAAMLLLLLGFLAFFLVILTMPLGD
jgi:hypothetical protein